MALAPTHRVAREWDPRLRGFANDCRVEVGGVEYEVRRSGDAMGRWCFSATAPDGSAVGPRLRYGALLRELARQSARAAEGPRRAVRRAPVPATGDGLAERDRLAASDARPSRPRSRREAANPGRPDGRRPRTSGATASE